jgi:hypothetical protein
MIFKQHGAPVLLGTNPHADEKPTPSTWRKFVLGKNGVPNEYRKQYEHDLAFATCPNGHECRINGKVHTIEANGDLNPSYVCPVKDCGFHVFVTLEGWQP